MEAYSQALPTLAALGEAASLDCFFWFLIPTRSSVLSKRSRRGGRGFGSRCLYLLINISPVARSERGHWSSCEAAGSGRGSPLPLDRDEEDDAGSLLEAFLDQKSSAFQSRLEILERKRAHSRKERDHARRNAEQAQAPL